MSDGTASIRIRVAAVVTAIPGAGGDGILADLPALRVAELRGTEPSDALQLWSRGDGSVAERLRAALPGTATVSAVGDSATTGAISSATSGLRLGAAGALLLAAIAVAAVIGADLRARESDIAVLRALGADAARQGRDRALEHLAVLAYGAATGVLGGLAVSAVLVPGLARATVPDLIPGLPIAVRVAPVDLSVGAGALAAGIAALLVVTAGRIRARARTAVVAEAVR